MKQRAVQSTLRSPRLSLCSRVRAVRTACVGRPAITRRVICTDGDPARAYPYSVGFADEIGSGRGFGYNINHPLPLRADDDLFVSALSTACEQIAAFGPAVLIVSLGLDTYITDPISDLAVTTPGMRRSGEVVRQLGLPTIVLQEGGYDVSALGANVAAWLTGLGA